MYIHLQSNKSSGIATATICVLANSRLCGRVVHWQFPLLHDNLYKADKQVSKVLEITCCFWCKVKVLDGNLDT